MVPFGRGSAQREHKATPLAQRASVEGTSSRGGVKLPTGGDDAARYPHQPTRVVVGHRDLPADANLRDDAAPLLRVATREPAEVLDALDDALWVLVEGGPTLAGAFVAAGLVDSVEAYVAPVLLGAGRNAVDVPTITTLADAVRFTTREVVGLAGGDVFVRMSR